MNKKPMLLNAEEENDNQEHVERQEDNEQVEEHQEENQQQEVKEEPQDKQLEPQEEEKEKENQELEQEKKAEREIIDQQLNQNENNEEINVEQKYNDIVGQTVEGTAYINDNNMVNIEQTTNTSNNYANANSQIPQNNMVFNNDDELNKYLESIGVNMNSYNQTVSSTPNYVNYDVSNIKILI